jgi:23S rRNA (cytosine1962-C5)-methyltransferase
MKNVIAAGVGLRYTCPAMAYAAFTLDETTAAILRRGTPTLPLDRVKGAAQAEPGQPMRLLDPQNQLVAIGVADPDNELLRVLAGAPTTLDLAFFKKRVTRALELRKSLGLGEDGDAFRLLNSEGDGVSGFTCDVFGEWAVVWAYARGLMTMGKMVGQAVKDVLGLKGVVVKLRPKGGVKAGQLKQDIVGEQPPESIQVKELGQKYEVHLLAGLNVGLFLDMREQRRGLGRFVKGRNVLNTFCYTGSLSVTAAVAGAASVTSVDLSGGVLRWAEENFRLAGFDTSDPRWRFVTSDVGKYLKQEKQKNGRFGAIILDPPTFSTARASSWSIRDDYPDLIALAMDVIDDSGGFVFVASNEQRGRGPLAHIDDALARSSRRARVLETAGLPPDFCTHPAYPDGRYLEIAHIWVEAV